MGKLNRYCIHSNHPDIGYELVDDDFGTTCDADEAQEIIDALTKERDELKEALEFYAHGGSYGTIYIGMLIRDCGHIARKALVRLRRRGRVISD